MVVKKELAAIAAVTGAMGAIVGAGGGIVFHGDAPVVHPTPEESAIVQTAEDARKKDLTPDQILADYEKHVNEDYAQWQKTVGAKQKIEMETAALKGAAIGTAAGVAMVPILDVAAESIADGIFQSRRRKEIIKAKKTFKYSDPLKGKEALEAVFKATCAPGWRSSFNNLDCEEYQGYVVMTHEKKPKLVGYFEYDARNKNEVTIRSFPVDEKPKRGSAMDKFIRGLKDPNPEIAPIADREKFDNLFKDTAIALGGKHWLVAKGK